MNEATTSALGGIKIAKDNANYTVATNTSPAIDANVTNAGKYYGIEIDSTGKAYTYVPWSNTTYSQGTGISISNTVINHADTSTLEGSYGPTANVAGDNNATIVIPQITVDGFGHVTGVTNRTYTSKNTTYSVVTTSNNGLMSKDDKSKLDGIEAGANKYILPTATDTTLGGVNKGYTIPYVVGSSSDSAGVWTGSCAGITSYKDGLTIIYVPQQAGISGGTTLNINGLGAKACYINNSKMTTHFSANVPILLTYITQSGVGYWKHADYTDGNTYTSAYCTTSGGTAAKSASLSNYILTPNTYTFISISNANTVKGAITLNINGRGAKPIHINGSASSASNYTLPAGTYIVYYDGTNYHFRTDGKLPGELLTNLNQNVISGVSDFSFYDNGTDANTVYLQLKSGQDKRTGLYFDTVNLATGGTGETFAAGGGISIAAATTSKAGVMSAADKTKLDGIATGANKYTLPNATSSTLGGVKIGSNISVSSGTISLSKSNVTSALGYTPIGPTGDYTVGNLTGNTFIATDSSGYTSTISSDCIDLTDGSDTYVEIKTTGITAPKFITSGGTSSQFVRGNGFCTALTKSEVTTALGYTPPTTNTTYSNATTSKAGLMSAADKTKLNSLGTNLGVTKDNDFPDLIGDYYDSIDMTSVVSLTDGYWVDTNYVPFTEDCVYLMVAEEGNFECFATFIYRQSGCVPIGIVNTGTMKVNISGTTLTITGTDGSGTFKIRPIKLI